MDVSRERSGFCWAGALGDLSSSFRGVWGAGALSGFSPSGPSAAQQVGSHRQCRHSITGEVVCRTASLELCLHLGLMLCPLRALYPEYTTRCCAGQEESALNLGVQKTLALPGAALPHPIFLQLSAFAAATAGPGKQRPSCRWDVPMVGPGE